MESNSQITVGTYIRELRKNKDVSINNLVGLSGISKGYISQIENNKFIPSPEILEKIANALDVPHLYLMEKAGHTKDLDKIEISQMVLHDLHELKKYKTFELDHIVDKENLERVVLEIQEIDQDIVEVHKLSRYLKKYNKGLSENGELNFGDCGDLEDVSIEETKKTLEYKKTKLDLENLFNSAQEITINNKTLTNEEKQKALQILKLTFDK